MDVDPREYEQMKYNQTEYEASEAVEKAAPTVTNTLDRLDVQHHKLAALLDELRSRLMIVSADQEGTTEMRADNQPESPRVLNRLSRQIEYVVNLQKQVDDIVRRLEL